MKCVVSNTSPLTNLAAIGEFALLEALFGRIHIPEGVSVELAADGGPWPGRDEVQAANWVERHKVENQPLVDALCLDLDRGEAESIALALELSSDLILLDERDGRYRAEALGLSPMGVVGVLLLAKKSGLLPTLKPALDALRDEAGFYLGDAVYSRGLEVADEP